MDYGANLSPLREGPDPNLDPRHDGGDGSKLEVDRCAVLVDYGIRNAHVISIVIKVTIGAAKLCKNVATAANKEVVADCMLSNQFVQHQLHMPSLVTHDSPDLLESSSRLVKRKRAPTGDPNTSKVLHEAKSKKVSRASVGVDHRKTAVVTKDTTEPIASIESHMVQQCNNQSVRLRAETDHPVSNAFNNKPGDQIVVTHAAPQWATSGSTRSGSRRGKRKVTDSLSGSHLVPQISDRNVSRRYTLISETDQRCRHCGAMLWYEEREVISSNERKRTHENAQGRSAAAEGPSLRRVWRPTASARNRRRPTVMCGSGEGTSSANNGSKHPFIT
ncbi:hypothetical protein Tco_0593439 [Tanacetum coccineum]